MCRRFGLRAYEADNPTLWSCLDGGFIADSELKRVRRCGGRRSIGVIQESAICSVSPSLSVKGADPRAATIATTSRGGTAASATAAPLTPRLLLGSSGLCHL